MRRIYNLAVSLALVLVAACSGDSPTAVGTRAAVLRRSTSTAPCQDVQATATFTLDLALSAALHKNVFTGPLAGDLTGTLVVVHDGPVIPPPPNPGDASHIFSEATFITDQFGTFSGDQPFVSVSVTPTFFRFSGQIRITVGDQITSGFLEAHGSVDASGLPTGEVTFVGQICR